MHKVISVRALALVFATIALLALWVICLYLLMATTTQLLDTLNYVIEIAQLS